MVALRCWRVDARLRPWLDGIESDLYLDHLDHLDQKSSTSCDGEAGRRRGHRSYRGQLPGRRAACQAEAGRGREVPPPPQTGARPRFSGARARESWGSKSVETAETVPRRRAGVAGGHAYRGQLPGRGGREHEGAWSHASRRERCAPALAARELLGRSSPARIEEDGRLGRCRGLGRSRDRSYGRAGFRPGGGSRKRRRRFRRTPRTGSPAFACAAPLPAPLPARGVGAPGLDLPSSRRLGIERSQEDGAEAAGGRRGCPPFLPRADPRAAAGARRGRRSRRRPKQERGRALAARERARVGAPATSELP